MRSKPLTSLGNFPSPILPTSAGTVESAGTMVAAMSTPAASVAASTELGVMAVAACSETTSTPTAAVTSSAATTSAARLRRTCPG